MESDWTTEIEQAWRASYEAAGRHMDLILRAVADGRDWEEICFAGHIPIQALEFIVVNGRPNRGI